MGSEEPAAVDHGAPERQDDADDDHPGRYDPQDIVLCHDEMIRRRLPD
jgi:hypothetical protein